MKEDPEKDLTLDDIIKATETMDGAAYRDYMELPVKERIEVAGGILKRLEESGGSV